MAADSGDSRVADTNPNIAFAIRGKSVGKKGEQYALYGYRLVDGRCFAYGWMKAKKDPGANPKIILRVGDECGGTAG